MSSHKLTVGTRGSKLALIQTQIVVDLLKRQYPDYNFKIQVIKTSGDKGKLDSPGAFVTEIEKSLLNGDTDLAVHSLKDLTVDMSDALILSAILPREDPREVIVLREGLFFDPEEKYIVGTSSPRRKLLLEHYFPNFTIVPISGNVDSRIAKVDAGELDGVMLAAAGLIRIGLAHRISMKLPISKFLPAPGQGALAVQIRKDESLLYELTRIINNKNSELETSIEKIILQEISSGCSIPLGAYAIQKGGSLIELSAFYGNNNKGSLNFLSTVLSKDHPEVQAKKMALKLKHNYAQ